MNEMEKQHKQNKMKCCRLNMGKRKRNDSKTRKLNEENNDNDNDVD